MDREGGTISAALLAVATAYLLATAWFHAAKPTAAGAPPARLANLSRWLICDLAIGSLAVLLIVQGHQAKLMQAGQWSIPPVLLGVSAASALAGALDLREEVLRRSAGAPGGEAPGARVRGDIPRTLSLALLLVVLFLAA
jgi:hypothetical protein